MKNNKSLIQIIVLLTIAIAVIAAWYLLASDELVDAVPASAQAISVNGKVERLVADGEVAGVVNRGDRLLSGEGVKTSEQSSATLRFYDESLLLVGANSQVMLAGLLRSETGGQTETTIRVDNGSIESRVNKQSGFGARYKVVTPALQLAVRGTVFMVTVDKETGLASSSVIEGSVEASAEGKTVILDAGFSTSASPGEPPEQPQKMADAPKLLQVASIQRRLPLNIVWEQHQGVNSYRLQLLSGDNADSLVFEADYDAPPALLSNLPDADYTLKVKAIGSNGLEGLAAEQRFTLDAHPVAPVIKSPLNGAVSTRKKTRFFWESSAEAATYLFQVSDYEDFENVVSEIKQLPGNMNGISIKLNSGNYFWRIASIDKQGEQGPFSLPHPFVVERK